MGEEPSPNPGVFPVLPGLRVSLHDLQTARGELGKLPVLSSKRAEWMWDIAVPSVIKLP